MPVYDDFRSAGVVVSQLETALESSGVRVTAVLVDDGSSEPAEGMAVEPGWRTVERVEVVRLRRNLGHQRAIAVGLAWVFEEETCDAVVVMDADGQDHPREVPRLIAACERQPRPAIVFAARSRRRAESLAFRCGYQLYKALHAVLVGFRVRVGNFSIVPWSVLERLVAVTELWNHYAAGVFKARLPYTTIDVERGPRISGTTRMDFAALLAHGLSAISVFSERVGARLILLLTVLAVGLLASAGVFLTVGAASGGSVSRWATTTVVLAAVLFSQVVLVTGGVVFFIMSNRERLGFVPLRDYRYFVLGSLRLHPAPGRAPPAEPMNER